MTKETIINAKATLKEAFNNALDIITNAVKNTEGHLIKTIPLSNVSHLEAIFVYSFSPIEADTTESEYIYGLRWDEEQGLTLCTSSMMRNYEFDNDYGFEIDRNFDEFMEYESGKADWENLNKMLDDASYFVSFDELSEKDLNKTLTIISIISGLEDFVE